jgi:hypothetical protein
MLLSDNGGGSVTGLSVTDGCRWRAVMNQGCNLSKVRRWSILLTFQKLTNWGAVRVPWSTPFYEAIILPDGRKLITLKDAAIYITSLPQKESALPEWQTAIEVLMLCSRGGDTMMERMGVLKALHWNVVREFKSDRKETQPTIDGDQGID